MEVRSKSSTDLEDLGVADNLNAMGKIHAFTSLHLVRTVDTVFRGWKRNLSDQRRVGLAIRVLHAVFLCVCMRATNAETRLILVTKQNMLTHIQLELDCSWKPH